MRTRAKAATSEGMGRGRRGFLQGGERSGSGAGFGIIQPVCVQGLDL